MSGFFCTLFGTAAIFLFAVSGSQVLSCDAYGGAYCPYLCGTTNLTACYPSWLSLLGPYQLSVGIEGYQLSRDREGGTHQEGNLYGYRLVYERIKGCGLHWAVEYSWAQGNLHGHSGGGGALKSLLTEDEIEGRFGYSFTASPKEGCWCISLTPFVGGGYYKAVNRYAAPTSLRLRFEDTVSYLVLGSKIRFSCSPNWNVGIQYRVRYPYEARDYVTEDPDFPDQASFIENKPHQTWEFPLHLRLCFGAMPVTVAIVPFLVYRHFGARENSPMDYIDTKFKTCGLRFAFLRSF